MRCRRLVAQQVRGLCQTSPVKQDRVLPQAARCVIVGGGVVGCSVAYHLSKHWSTPGDIVLLEQNSLTSGTTWHAAGLVGVGRATAQESALSLAGARLYETLEEETGQSPGYKRCGSITVARTKDRMRALQGTLGRVRSFGIEGHMVSPEECVRLWSHDGDQVMSGEGLEGGLWFPMDGTASPTDLTQALIIGAKSRGVQVYEGVTVEGFETASVSGASIPRVHAVRTAEQTITCEHVVLCAGQWSRQMGKMVGVDVPLHSAEHYYVITQPIPGCHSGLPVMRDPDVYVYAREWGGGLCVGGFEPHAKPIWTGGVPSDFAFGLLPDDWDQFSMIYEGAMERVPALETVEVQSMVNGPESFTADNRYMLGESPQVSQFYVAAGMNSSGIASAGGAGKAIAEWVVNGSPTYDLSPIDIRRFGKHDSTPAFLRARTTETLGLHYTMPWPYREPASCRRLRVSPLYSRLAQQGAVWGQKFGWERANYFIGGQDTPGGVGTDQFHASTYTFGRPVWSATVREECLHARREGCVALFDLTSFTKILVQGRDATRAMQLLCCNDVATGVEKLQEPLCKVTYTGMLNERGGYETDCTVTRLSSTEYMVVSPTANAVRDAHWIRSHIDPDDFVTVTDVTSSTAVIAVMGPQSRDLLGRLSYSDWSEEAFPPNTSREIDVGFVTVRAMRVSYVGELGWELHCPAESAHAVYDALHQGASATQTAVDKGEEDEGDGAGKAVGDINVRDCGYFAVESLRLEKGYRAWGHELTPDTTPRQAGMNFTVAAEKEGGFIGDGIVINQLSNSPASERLLMLSLDRASHVWFHGGELIYVDNQICGRLSSGGYGYTLDQPIGMGYIDHAEVWEKGFVARWNDASRVQVEVAGVKHVAKVQLKPLLG